MKYSLIFLLLLSQVCFAQPFSTKVSSTTIGKNDVIEVEYTVEDADMEQFNLPRFNTWTVISGPNLSSDKIITGSSIKQRTVYSVMLQPQRQGMLVVPGATALINSKPTRSNEIRVVVKNVDHVQGAQVQRRATPSILQQLQIPEEVPTTQYLKRGENALDKIRTNMMVRLELSKSSCYVGEPILATYKLCTRLRSKSKVTKQPSFSGCTVIELTDNYQEQHVEKINGTEYNVFVIRKVQLIPLEAGQLILPATFVENTVSFYNTNRLSYRDLYYGAPSVPVEEKVVTLQNRPVAVAVKALPPYPAVANAPFSGAVGQLDISISSGNVFTTNHTNHLLVTVQGEGNLQEIKNPGISWPKGIEAFEPTESDEVDKNSFPIKSSKIFSIPFIAEKAGSYIIPPFQFVYFDPSAARYVTKLTPGFLLKVAPGKKGLFSKAPGMSLDDGSEQTIYIIIAAALLAALIGFAWYYNRSRKGVVVKTKVAPTPVIVQDKKEELRRSATEEYIFNIRALQPDNDSSAFYKQLCYNLTMYVQNKFRIKTEELPQFIYTHPYEAPLLNQLKKLFENCTLGMYTPVFTIEEAMQHRLTAIEILNRVEKEIV